MDFDGYCELSSDDEDNAICCSHHYSSDSASDDDGDLSTILQYSANRSKLQGLCGTADASNEADPFEEELAGELDQAMLKLRTLDGSTCSPSKTFGASCLPHAGSCSSGSNSKELQQDKAKSQYDSIYFDSDEDDDDEGVQKRRATQSDADLLYDPTLDDQDQQWMDDYRAAAHRTGFKRRDKNVGTGSKSQKRKHQQTKPGKGSALPDSDAILNCPGCLTMLCADCQRHAIYNTQFRAMFVFSCKVDYTQLLRFPTKLTKKEIWKNKKLERKMRQEMKKNEDNSNGVHSSQVLKENILLRKEETNEVIKMECNDNRNKRSLESSGDGDGTAATECNNSSGLGSESSGNRSGTIEPGSTDGLDCAPGSSSDSPSENAILRLSDPIKESKAQEILSNNEAQNHEEANSLPAKKKVRFTTQEDNEEDLKTVNNSEGSVSSGIGSQPVFVASGGGLLQSQDEELFHPVTCQHCNTKVAVFDKDEVYHFFNVITSY